MANETRFSQLADLVLSARALPADACDAFLRSECGDDDDLYTAAKRLAQIPTAEAERLEENPLGPLVERPQFAPGTIFGKFRIIEKIADGGMSTVYRAEHLKSHHAVALKFLNPSGLRFSTREHEILGELSHDNIARLFDSDMSEEGVPYLVLEYVEGESVARYCDAHALSLDKRLELFLAICRGIQYAHNIPIVHRDIKPENVIITEREIPKIVDFGIARSLPKDITAATLTHGALQPLTLAFASPEQVLAHRVGIPSDIYSLGVLLCVLLTGRLPYHVRTPGDLYAAIPTQEPTRLSELVDAPRKENPDGELHYPYLGPTPPPGEPHQLKRRLAGDLDAIVSKALRKEPEKRYQTVAEFAADVRNFLDDEPVSARKGGTQYRAWKFCRRNTGAVVGTAVAALIILGLLVGLFIEQRATARQRDQAQDVARVLNKIFTLDNPWTTSGAQVSAREMLDRASEELNSLSLEPVRKATALYTLGNLYSQLGIYPKAKELLSKSLDLRAERLGAAHDDTIATQNALGGALYYLGEYPEAERLLRQAEHVLRGRKAGRQDELVSVLTNLARVFFEEGKPAEAERLEREALQFLEARRQGESKEAAELHSHLGLTLSRLDRLPEAEVHHRRSLEIRTRLFGPDHPTTGNAHHNLALNLNSQRKYAEAEGHFRKALVIARRSLPKEHPIIPAILDSLASTCAHQKRFAEAETLVREALAIKRQILPKAHPSIPMATVNLASIIVEADINRLPEAEPLYLDSIADFRRLAGSRSRQVGITLYTYGRALLRHGEPSRAKPILEEATQTIRAVNGPNHIETALVERTYARSLLALDDMSAAEPLLANAVRVFHEHQPQDPHELASTLTSLGRCRLNLRDSDGAALALREAYTLFSEHNDLSSPEGKELLAQFHALVGATHDPEKAAEYRKLLEEGRIKKAPK